MYFGIFSKLLILLIVINYGYAKMYNSDIMDYIIKNKTVSNVFNIAIIGLALYYLFNRDFFLPFLGPAVIPVAKIENKLDDMINVNLNKLPPNTNIIYWASQKSEGTINDPIVAYKDYSNSGVAISDNMGNANIKIACPSPYYVNKFGIKKKLLNRHVHYRYELPDYKGIYSSVYTKDIDSC
jgi:hypothetical protein